MNTCFWDAVGEILGLCGTCWGNFGKMNGLFFWALYHFEVILGPSWSYSGTFFKNRGTQD